MEYYLMRKNEVITLCDIDGSGSMLDFSPNYREPELAPPAFSANEDHIKRWWKNRHIPVRQGRVEQMLREKGFDEPSQYLLCNLGLSLTDYYWIRPVDSALKWEDVNLFDNDFKENIMQPLPSASTAGPETCSPNSSLKGELEKSWMIRKGKRVLVKGNRGRLSTESINEAVASEFHKAQRYDNYTKYHLIHIKDKPYDYGCWSEAFTDNRRELVSAFDLLTSEPDDGSESQYERLIRIAGSHGIDTEQLRDDLEYQIMSDYILSNTDRHMDNIGFIRDADTLRLLRMAPIFDTGRAFGGGAVTPYTDEEIDNIEVNSFADNETGLLRLVRNRDAVDPDRFLPAERVRELQEKDTKIRPGQIDMIVRLYKKKIERTEGRAGMR